MRPPEACLSRAEKVRLCQCAPVQRLARPQRPAFHEPALEQALERAFA